MTPYFVFLKAKRGEYGALAKLDAITRKRFVPVVELLPPPPPRQTAGRPQKAPLTMDQQVANHIQRISDSSSTCYPVLVDFTYMPHNPTSDGRHPASVIMSTLRSRGIKVSPIVRPSAPLI